MPVGIPSRNDGVTMRTCPVCGGGFAPAGRRRWCSDACRQAAHRRRHQPQAPVEPLPPPRPRRPSTLYACPTCDQRYLGEQRCPDCNIFCQRVGYGGHCPCCDEPVAHDELS
jgi:predicted nucleic acid-binding Zn ribbon protein